MALHGRAQATLAARGPRRARTPLRQRIVAARQSTSHRPLTPASSADYFAFFEATRSPTTPHWASMLLPSPVGAGRRQAVEPLDGAGIAPPSAADRRTRVAGLSRLRRRQARRLVQRHAESEDPRRCAERDPDLPRSSPSRLRDRQAVASRKALRGACSRPRQRLRA